MKQSNVIILPPSSWLITLGNGAILDILYWYLLLADWELTSGYSQVSLGEWISTLLCPCISPSLLPWSHYSWARQAMTGVAGEGDWYQQNESYDPLHINSAELTNGEHLFGAELSSHPATVWRDPATYLAQKSLSPIFWLCSFQILVLSWG